MRYFLFCLLLVISNVYSQADTEIIHEKTDIYVVNKYKIKIHRYAKKIIYNNVDNNNSYFHVNYQEDHKPKIKYIKIYDIKGKLLKNVLKSDIYHTNMSPNNVLYTDFFNCYYELKRPELPYVIEYEYEHYLENILSIPDWHPLGYYTKTQKSEYLLHVPKDMEIVYKLYNFSPNYSKRIKEDEIVHKWNFSSEVLLTNKVDQRYKINHGFPSLLIKTNSFFMKEVSGNFSSWSGFGDFYYDLNIDRKIVPNALKLKLDKFKSNSKNKIDLLKKIYNYLQETKRYVFINLDLSGYQSMTVEAVDEQSFGDCKALSNYLESSLNYVGIESYSVLVKGARNEFKFDSEFVNNQFNHVICCSIIEGDTIWLESTSKNSPVNYLGSFTSNRPALIIKKDESKLVLTPNYINDFNFSDVKINASLNENNSADLLYDFKFYGVNQERFRSQFNNVTEAGIKKYLQAYFSYLGSFTIKEYSIIDVSIDSAFVHFNVLIEKSDFYQKLGSNYVLNLAVFQSLRPVPTLFSTESENVFYPYGIKERFHVSIDFTKISENQFTVKRDFIDLESKYAIAKSLLENRSDGQVNFSFSYSINQFQDSSEEFKTYENIFKEIHGFFNTKIVVKSGL
jgi:hypothetical protein